jgi:hypothetical protein
MQLKTTQLKLIYGLNAAIAFIGFIIQFVINLFDLVPIESEYPTLLGGHPAGAAGIVGRLTDSFSYFTIWSNLVVVIVLFLLYRNPDRSSFRFKVLRLDSLLMITITGVVYHILIRPYFPPVSWNVYSDIFLHTITPIATVSIWILVGPRNWISIKIVFYSLLVPIIWLGYTLIRGVIIDKYPYDFLDVITLGYLTVLITVVILVIVGLLIAFGYLLLEKLLSRKS